jgi:hypothetical protein
MDWIIVNHASGVPLNERQYPDEVTARRSLTQLGEAFSRMYRPIPSFVNPYWYRALMEGFKPSDLENILLPQFSIDVYVPGDPNTDNIVCGFLIKGVPEAVFPFKQFLSFCAGVKHVDYGDSDTLPHTSIVYVEFDRERFRPASLDGLIDQVCRISGFDPEDFSVSFPNSSKTFPYSKKLIEEYFEERSQRKNRLAQDKAIHDRTQELQTELEHEMQHGNIAKMLGGSAAQSAPPVNKDAGLQHLKAVTGGTGIKGKTTKPDKGPEISDVTKNMIVNDAKRNLGSHTETWEQFDKRWSSRLRVTPSRVSSIRKKIYDL